MISSDRYATSILNVSSLADSNTSDNSSVADQETSDTQSFPEFAFQEIVGSDASNHGSGDLLKQGSVNVDLFNHGFGGSIGEDQQLPQLPSSDLKLWEAIPVVSSNSHLSQFLQPPNSQLIDLSNLNGLQHLQPPSSQLTDHGIFHGLQSPSSQLVDLSNFNGYDQHSQYADAYDDVGINDYYGKPNFGGLFGGLGGLKTPFPRHKLKKLIRQSRHPGLFRKHRSYGSYFGDSGSYLSNLAQLTSSLYQPFIPKFTPFPINFPSFGGSGGGPYELELFKAILIPLAGVALMGAAATTMLVTNPFIWTLPFSLLIGPSTFGSFFGRRRRRSAELGSDKNVTVMSEVVRKKIEEIKVLDDFLKKTSKKEVIDQEKKVLATYLMTQSVCLDRLVCSLHRPNLPDSMTKEARVMNIVTKEILENEFVPQIIHDNILRARQVGLASGNCQTFLCQPINYWAHHKR